MHGVAAYDEAGLSRHGHLLLHLSMFCGATAGAVVAPALVLARAQELGAGPTMLVVAGALPGLAGLATAWGVPVLGCARRTTLLGIAVSRLLVVLALLSAAWLPPAGAVVGLLAALLAAQVIGIVVGGAAMAWFMRLLGRRDCAAVTARRNALGGAVGFAAALAAAALVGSGGEQGWRWLAAIACLATVIDLALLGGLPPGQADLGDSPASTCSPAGYQRLWWCLHAGGALAAVVVLPALATAGAGSSWLIVIGGASVAGGAVGMWRHHRLAVGVEALAAGARLRVGSLLLLTLCILSPALGVPLPIALAASALAAGLEGIAAGRCAVLDTVVLYHLGGSDAGRLIRLSAAARTNGGLIALAAVLLAALGAGKAAVALPLLLVIAVVISILGWRSLAAGPPLPTLVR